MPNYLLSQQQIERIARAVRKVEADIVSLRGEKTVTNYLTLPFLAEITGYSSIDDEYEWRRQIIDDDSNFRDFLPAQTGFALDLTGRKGLPNGTIVQLWYAGNYSDSKPIFVFFELPLAHFAVKVTQVGGSSGSASTACSYTYSVVDAMTGQFLGGSNVTPLSPVKRRPALGAMVAPTANSYGVGYYDETGAFKLWDANEVPDVEECEE